MRDSTTEVEGLRLCTQHAQRARRRRVVYLVDGGWFKVAKSA
jgi:hypothetical protein